MSRYVVFEPPEAVSPSEAAIFLRDRFSFLAFVFTFLWMFRYGLWLSGLVTVALLVALNVLGTVEGFEMSAALISMLLGILIGLEGPSLRAAKLRRKGWNDVAAFEAQNSDEAELIYYYSTDIAAIAPPVPPIAPASPVAPAAPTMANASTEPAASSQGSAEPDEPATSRAIVPTPFLAARPVNAPAAPIVNGEAGELRPADGISPTADASTTADPGARLKAELERAAKVEGWAERWDKPGTEIAKLSGGRRRPVGRL